MPTIAKEAWSPRLENHRLTVYRGRSQTPSWPRLEYRFNEHKATFDKYTSCFSSCGIQYKKTLISSTSNNYGIATKIINHDSLYKKGN